MSDSEREKIIPIAIEDEMKEVYNKSVKKVLQTGKRRWSYKPLLYFIKRHKT